MTHVAAHKKRKAEGAPVDKLKKKKFIAKERSCRIYVLKMLRQINNAPGHADKKPLRISRTAGDALTATLDEELNKLINSAYDNAQHSNHGTLSQADVLCALKQRYASDDLRKQLIEAGNAAVEQFTASKG